MAHRQTPPSTSFRLESLQDAADRVHLGVRTLRRYIAEGKLPAYTAGRSLRVRPEEVNALFNRVNTLKDVA